MILTKLGPLFICIFAYDLDFAEIIFFLKNLHGTVDIAESSSEVLLTTSSQAVFCDSNLLWPEIYGLKHFYVEVQRFEINSCFLFVFIRIDSAVLMTQWSQTPRCHWFHRVKLCGVIDTAELSSLVPLTPQSFYDTVESQLFFVLTSGSF